MINLKPLYEFLSENELLSETEMDMIQYCLNDIVETSPNDKPGVFRKSEKLIQDSQNLSWCIYSLRLQYDCLNKAYRKIKDPEYTLLVRQQRPSSEAINSELRAKFEELYDLEEKLSTINNIIDYLSHIQTSMERYIYLLKDRLKYSE